MIRKFNKFQLFLIIYLIANIIYIPLGMYAKKISSFTYQNFSQGMIILLLVNITIILFIALKKKYNKNIIDFLSVLILIFGVISTIFAFRYDYALFGFKGRYEGLFQITYYMTLFLITTFLDKENKKIIIYTVLFTGLVQVFVAHDQYLYKTSLMSIGEIWFDIIKGLTTNSNFLGTYILICLCYSICLFMEEKNNIEKTILLMLIIIFVYGLLLSNALSSVVGLILVFVFLLIYCIKDKKKIKYGVIILITIALLLIMDNNKSTTILKDIKTTMNQTTSIATGHVDDSYGTDRIYIWRKTLKIVPQELLNGVGIDNFSYAFDGKPLKHRVRATLYDKAHNEYLQILVTEGLFALVSYLVFYYLIIRNGIKRKNIYMLLPIIGYLIQAFFNISVIEVAPLFYISCGLLYDRKTIRN